MTATPEVLLIFVTNYLQHNEGLTRLLALSINAYNDERLPFPENKLVGEWGFARAGQKISLTFTNPYKVEEGYIFYLPGLADMYQHALVHIPNTHDNPEAQSWYTLKHVALFADTIELKPDL